LILKSLKKTYSGTHVVMMIPEVQLSFLENS